MNGLKDKNIKRHFEDKLPGDPLSSFVFVIVFKLNTLYVNFFVKSLLNLELNMNVSFGLSLS